MSRDKMPEYDLSAIVKAGKDFQLKRQQAGTEASIPQNELAAILTKFKGLKPEKLLEEVNEVAWGGKGEIVKGKDSAGGRAFSLVSKYYTIVHADNVDMYGVLKPDQISGRLTVLTVGIGSLDLRPGANDKCRNDKPADMYVYDSDVPLLPVLHADKFADLTPVQLRLVGNSLFKPEMPPFLCFSVNDGQAPAILQELLARSCIIRICTDSTPEKLQEKAMQRMQERFPQREIDRAMGASGHEQQHPLHRLWSGISKVLTY